MIHFQHCLERCPSGLRYTLGRGAYPQGTGGSNPPLSVIFRTLLMSPGAMQEVIIQPRQVRKKAAADS